MNLYRTVMSNKINVLTLLAMASYYLVSFVFGLKENWTFLSGDRAAAHIHDANLFLQDHLNALAQGALILAIAALAGVFMMRWPAFWARRFLPSTHFTEWDAEQSLEIQGRRDMDSAGQWLKYLLGLLPALLLSPWWLSIAGAVAGGTILAVLAVILTGTLVMLFVRCQPVSRHRTYYPHTTDLVELILQPAENEPGWNDKQEAIYDRIPPTSTDHDVATLVRARALGIPYEPHILHDYVNMRDPALGYGPQQRPLGQRAQNLNTSPHTVPETEASAEAPERRPLAYYLALVAIGIPAMALLYLLMYGVIRMPFVILSMEPSIWKALAIVWAAIAIIRPFMNMPLDRR